MALNVSAWSIRRPLPAIVAALVALALGIVSFQKLPITLLPNVDPPVVSIVVTDFGAPPSALASHITKPIENAVAGVFGVKHIMSSISDGVSATTITFNLSTNSDRALKDVKAAVAGMRDSLPPAASAPKIQRINAVGLGILTYAASSTKKTPEQLSYFVDHTVVPKLKKVHGVSSVERMGGVKREILVTLNPERLQAYGLSAVAVSRRLAALNETVASGAADKGGHGHTQIVSGPRSLAELAGTMISLPKGGAVRLDKLGTVRDTIAQPRGFARLDGHPIVGFTILRAKGASDVSVAAGVKTALKQVHAADPGVSIRLIDTSVHYTEGNYDSALHTLFEGAALAVIVVFVFLRDLRATVIAAIALPLSIVPAFWVMYALGFSLNLVSLLAITLATGILVDDAIVEIENIVRHMRMGKSAFQAALDAADEIGLAVIAISLTIVAVFAPVSFIGSIAGQYFKQFGLTVAAEVIFSLLAARLITPMLAAYFLKPRPHVEREGLLIRRYARMVEWSVVHRYKTVIIGLVLFALSILSLTTNLVSRDFQPTQDSGRSHLAIELPAGATLADTQRVVDLVAKRLKKWPQITSVLVDGGHIARHAPQVRDAQITINYVPKSQRNVSVQQLQAQITKALDQIPNIHHWFVDDYGARPVALIFTGPSGKAVTDFAAKLAQQMRTIPLITNVLASSGRERPELHIAPKPDRLAHFGVSKESFARTIDIALIGDAGRAAATFDDHGRLVPIRLKLDDQARRNPQVLQNLRVPTKAGGSVALGTIANIEVGRGPVTIAHYDRGPSATVSADIVGNAALSDVEAAIAKLPIMQHLPAGIKAHKTAAAEAMADLSRGFTQAMRDGLIMVYVVLVLLFANFLQPITILFSLPLSIGGAILALLITGLPLSMPVVIGILMLMGIVTKNAIMLVDFSVRAIAKGASRTVALVEAGKKRARPIVMTTIAMVAGMVPSALGLGAGGEFRSPMAIAVIGGLLVSTLLSLLFVPAVFAVMDDVLGVFKRAWRAVAFLPRRAKRTGETAGLDVLPGSSAQEPAE